MGINTPLPLRLPEEARKAAKIMRSFVDARNNGLDKVIPRDVLERAAGFAIFTVAKAGFLFSARAGSGIVIARTDDGSWSPPSGIAVGGMGFGGQAGAEVTDFVVVLNSRSAVANFMSTGSLTLGGNMSVAVGPLGRNAEGSGAVNTKGNVAAMYSYSKTKGLFGGMSVEGTVIAERSDANRLAYGGNPTAKQILTGTFDPPEWAYVLIDVLDHATGLPGGQRWVEDRPEDQAAMGWSSPSSKGSKKSGGYAFGEGVGAGGTSSRKRSSSLFSIGGGNKDPAGAMFANGSGRSSSPATPVPAPGPDAQRAPPNRPWEQRKASNYLNFGSAKKDPRRAAGPSSDTYNADFNTSQYTAKREGYGVKRPYTEKATPSPFVSEHDSQGSNSTRSSPPRSFESKEHDDSSPDHDLLGEWDPGAHQRRSSAGRTRKSDGNVRDLLGSWDADPHGLTANFGRVNLNGEYDHGHLSEYELGKNSPKNGRTRASTLQFDSIDENPPRLRESTSSYATRDWDLGKTNRRDERERRERPFSSYAPPNGWNWRDDPFSSHPSSDVDSDRRRSREDARRPFDDYMPSSNGNRSRSGSNPSRRLSVRKGLDGDADGHARAVALFDFAGGQDGDLGFRKGQVVVVLSSVGEGEWWRGRVATGGGEGIFPASYVEVVDIPRDLKAGIGRSQLRKRSMTAYDDL